MAFDAQKNIEYVEKQLAYFMMILGLDPNSLDTVTIDELLDAARDFSKVNRGQISNIYNVVENIGNTPKDIYAGSPEYVFLKNQRIFLILSIRRFWYWRQLALGALNREQ